MTIEIHRPELEALILERMRNGSFRNVEDVLMQALTSWRASVEDVATSPREDLRTGADLITALQSSPYREISIEPARYRLPVRDVAF